MTVLSVDGVSVVRDGKSLLDDVSFSVTDHSIVGIVGPNGAGKSTLLRVLSGDLVPDQGTANMVGTDVSGASLRQLAGLRSFVGPQTVSDVVFRVADVVAMGRHPDRGSAEDRESEQAMIMVDVAHLRDRSLRTLSSGEQQRVQLARAIAQRAPVMLLDEPTSALDVGHQELVMAVLRKLVDHGTTVIGVFHDLNLAAAHADQLLLVDHGVAVAQGSTRDVLTGPRLSEAYGEPMQVIDHPFRDCPLVLTTGRHA